MQRSIATLPKRTAFVASLVLASLVGCAQRGPAPLYSWGDFPRQQYETLARKGSTPEEQIRVMQNHAEQSVGSNRTLPPGFRAHLGLLHLQIGNFSAARASWEAEKTQFPESATYIDQLLKRLDGSAAAPTEKGKGA